MLVVINKRRRRYGVVHFLWDCLWTIVSGGLWLIWIFVRETRNN